MNIIRTQKFVIFQKYVVPLLFLLETHWRPTCLIGDQHASSKPSRPHMSTTCLSGDRDMHDWRPIGDQHV